MPTISVNVQVRDNGTNEVRTYTITMTNNQAEIAELTDTQMIALVTGVVDELLNTAESNT